MVRFLLNVQYFVRNRNKKFRFHAKCQVGQGYLKHTSFLGLTIHVVIKPIHFKCAYILVFTVVTSISVHGVYLTAIYLYILIKQFVREYFILFHLTKIYTRTDTAYILYMYTCPRKKNNSSCNITCLINKLPKISRQPYSMQLPHRPLHHNALFCFLIYL